MKHFPSLLAAIAVTALAITGAAGSAQAQEPLFPTGQPSGLEQVVLTPTGMAWVSSAEPGANFGGRGYIWVGYGHGTGGAPSTLRGLVQFDLWTLPRGVVVNEARLSANIIGAQGEPDHFVYRVGRALVPWSDSSVTWSNKPPSDLGPGLDISATSGQVSWDATDYVRGMVDGRWPNNGFYCLPRHHELLRR